MKKEKFPDISLTEITKKYQSKVNDAIIKLRSDLHQELFPEEYDFIYDSCSEAYSRQKGLNPMNEAYVKKVNERREILGVTSLNSNGSPADNSSQLFVIQFIIKLIKNNEEEQENIVIKKTKSITDFLKNTD
jgi:hypothetical protein